MRAVRDYGLAVLGGIVLALMLAATADAQTPDTEAPHDNCPDDVVVIDEPTTVSLPVVQMDVEQPPARLPETGAWNTGPVSLLAVACGLVGLVLFALWPGGRPQQ
jgi:hypothetical protein